MNNEIKKKIIEAGIEFYEIENDSRITRYKSWYYCHKAFKEAMVNKENGEKIDIDYLCFQLSTYLASWGMYRNSFLLWRDYKVHFEVIYNVILKKKYKSLWDIEVVEYKDEENIKLLEELINDIRKHYEPIRDDVYNFLKKDIKKDNGLTDTFISKILLGTIACVPAYDRYFKTGIHCLNISGRNLITESIKKIADNETVEDVLEEMSKKYSDNYPQMKLLDSCFWQLGYNIEKEKKKEKNKKNEKHEKYEKQA